MEVGNPESRARIRRGSTAECGFTYLLLLFVIAILGIGLAALGEFWVAIARQQNNTQLAWIEDQYKQAIVSYYQSSPGARKIYPETVQDLIDDKRSGLTRRHLRMIYLNPLTNQNDWKLTRGPDGKIISVRAIEP